MPLLRYRLITLILTLSLATSHATLNVLESQAYPSRSPFSISMTEALRQRFQATALSVSGLSTPHRMLDSLNTFVTQLRKYRPRQLLFEPSPGFERAVEWTLLGTIAVSVLVAIFFPPFRNKAFMALMASVIRLSLILPPSGPLPFHPLYDVAKKEWRVDLLEQAMNEAAQQTGEKLHISLRAVLDGEMRFTRSGSSEKINFALIGGNMVPGGAIEEEFNFFFNAVLNERYGAFMEGDAESRQLILPLGTDQMAQLSLNTAVFSSMKKALDDKYRELSLKASYPATAENYLEAEYYLGNHEIWQRMINRLLLDRSSDKTSETFMRDPERQRHGETLYQQFLNPPSNSLERISRRWEESAAAEANQTLLLADIHQGILRIPEFEHRIKQAAQAVSEKLNIPLHAALEGEMRIQRTGASNVVHILLWSNGQQAASEEVTSAFKLALRDTLSADEVGTILPSIDPSDPKEMLIFTAPKTRIIKALDVKFYASAEALYEDISQDLAHGASAASSSLERYLRTDYYLGDFESWNITRDHSLRLDPEDENAKESFMAADAQRERLHHLWEVINDSTPDSFDRVMYRLSQSAAAETPRNSLPPFPADEEPLNRVLQELALAVSRIKSERLNQRLDRSASLPEPLQPGQRMIGIGDIHGELQALLTLLVFNRLIDPLTGNWVGGSTILLTTGDTVGPGPFSLVTLSYLSLLQTQARRDGGDVIQLLGNRELYPLYDETSQGLSIKHYPAYKQALKARIASGDFLGAFYYAGIVFVHSIVLAKNSQDSSPEAFVEKVNTTVVQHAKSSNAFAFVQDTLLLGKDGIFTYHPFRKIIPESLPFHMGTGHLEDLTDGTIAILLKGQLIIFDVGLAKNLAFGVLEGDQFRAYSLVRPNEDEDHDAVYQDNRVRRGA